MQPSCRKPILSGWSILLFVRWAVVGVQATTSLDCSTAPDCTSLRRLGCDEQVTSPTANACGDCSTGAHGSPGPSLTKCLATDACAVIFAGSDSCPAVDIASMLREGFVIGFDTCQCDTDGIQWSSAPSACAKLEVDAGGSYQLWQCTDSTCAAASCFLLASWSPLSDSFDCQTRGGDSFLLSESCPLASRSQQDICGHPGYVTANPGSSFGEDCEVAPMCPNSVLSNRLAESCCAGTEFSNTVENGLELDERAPGFCTRDGASCLVVVNGPGWSGCACMDDEGSTLQDYVCTMECEAPECDAPLGGSTIPTTPTSWQTSEVPPVVFNTGRVSSQAHSDWRPTWQVLSVVFVLVLPVRTQRV
mmetsp:Transcript_41789/g.75856  ORF Transcript_41789/g.75856 Transcript_41789/m.75856 type:complete len:362 (-) Transcript_41789:32-1117(-)